MAPFDDSGWLIVRQKVGWGIVGGTLEPGENYVETLRRELLEEAGCELVDYEIFGSLRMRSLAPIPYRTYPILCLTDFWAWGKSAALANQQIRKATSRFLRYAHITRRGVQKASNASRGRAIVS